MDSTREIKQLLKKNLATSQESLKILKKMHKMQKLGRVFKILYWVVIISLVFGAYYFVLPYIQMLSDTFDDIKSDVSIIGTGPGSNTEQFSPNILKQIQGIIESFQSKES
ncbi:hypothetical protein ACFLZC_01710 [Patescibacteria group bacterium]